MAQVEQFVMAYGAEQDRLRAFLPEGYESLRPVLRINTEIRDGGTVYVEFNTPVQAGSFKGWLNVGNWISGKDPVSFKREGNRVTITAPFLTLWYEGTGAEGGCPAEKDNDGCWFLSGERAELKPAEQVTVRKEFCDCGFAWHFAGGDASGRSTGKTLPAFREEVGTVYPRQAFTPENAAAVPCRQVLGAYIVRFERKM